MLFIADGKKRMTRKIAYIGFGSIGQDVARMIAEEARFPCVQLALVREGSSSLENLPNYIMPMFSFHKMLACKPDIVVEVASQEAVNQYAVSCLTYGFPFLVSSTGALADPSQREKMLAAAERGNSKIIVPSGAIAGLDYIQAISRMDDAQVIYESRKPVQAWVQELQALGHKPEALKESLVLYQGNAQEAALKYPKNLNVAATLALAGLGMERTQVRVVVDPQSQVNQHIIEVQSGVGKMRMELSNEPSPSNPKTSWVVAQSVTATIYKYFSRLQIV